MVFGVESQRIRCPYCGETIEVLIDCSIEQQQYIEDCQVCCRPIAVGVSVDASGAITITARDENEVG